MTFLTISSSKEKGRLHDTFQFWIKNAFDTSNKNKSDQIHEEKFNRLSREGSIHDTALFNTNYNYDTFCIKATNRFNQIFNKGLQMMNKNAKNIH